MDGLGFHLLAVPKGCPYEATTWILHGGVIPKYLTNEDLTRARTVEGVEVATPMLLQQVTKDGTPHIDYGSSLTICSDLSPRGRLTDGSLPQRVPGNGDRERTCLPREPLAGAVSSLSGRVTSHLLSWVCSSPPVREDDNFHFLPLPEAQRVFNNDWLRL